MWLRVIAFSICVLLVPTVATADAEKEHLKQVLQELRVLETVLSEAERHAQNNTSPVKFTYQAFRNDIRLMKRGLEDYIDNSQTGPRYFPPMQGDYRR